MSSTPLAIVLAVATAACGGTDPCAGKTTCIALDVTSTTVARIDQLEVDILFGGVHATVTTQNGTHTTELPLDTAIVLDVTDSVAVGVVAAGKLGGTVLGTAAGQVTITPGHHASIALELVAPEPCTPASLYCGGDKIAGDPMTLYECNGGGVPLAHGACVYGCAIQPGDDDFCRGGGGTCMPGTSYCGGDKLDGDPETLYVCLGGSGTSPMRCTNSCQVRPGLPDRCL